LENGVGEGGVQWNGKYIFHCSLVCNREKWIFKLLTDLTEIFHS
jgi:hypothetical protein